MASSNSAFNDLARGQFIWLEELGVGYLECTVGPSVYDQAYFDRYRERRNTDISERLNEFRVRLAKEHAKDNDLIDVGIGDGAFLEALERAGLRGFGYDINPAGVKWLKDTKRWAEFYFERWSTVTFWDSLEHMRDPRPALYHVKDTALISVPVFENAEHARSSKHFRPDEHFWYFTETGLEIFLARQGLRVVDILDDETKIGREDIKTFIAKR